jgi:hypothetical protein
VRSLSFARVLDCLTDQGYRWKFPLGVTSVKIAWKTFGTTLKTGGLCLLNELTRSVLSEPITDPVPVFLTIMAIMLIAPLLFERLKLLVLSA